MDGCGLWVRRKADAQTGVRNQHRLQRPGARLGVRATAQQEADDSCVGFENEFEIKRNKAHGGCLGIERR
jgi:hypothetical protein